ncbi:MAG: hypothetical protein HQ518_03105 [Rhodopirellula sp.]|nr:hypothetical protein [Rhodopirellula sp.]
MNEPAPEPTDVSAEQPISQVPTGMHPAGRFLGMIVAGAVATSLAYTAVAGVGDVHLLPEEFMNLGGMPTPEEMAAANAAQFATNTGNAMVWLGITGAILGGVLALATGLLRRAGMGIVIGTVAGILAGGGLGYLAGNLAVSNHASLQVSVNGPSSQLEQQIMVLHGITWGIIGVGVGVGAGLARRTITVRSLLVSVIVAGTMGCVAGGVFPIIAGVAAPLENAVLPVTAHGTGRIIWMGLASLLIAGGLGRAD